MTLLLTGEKRDKSPGGGAACSGRMWHSITLGPRFKSEPLQVFRAYAQDWLQSWNSANDQEHCYCVLELEGFNRVASHQKYASTPGEAQCSCISGRTTA